MDNKTSNSSDLGYTFSMLLLRIWLGIRSLQTGIEKFAGVKTSETAVNIDGVPNAYGLTESTGEKAYALSNYHGVPQGLWDKFVGEPLIPNFMLPVYNIILGPALLIIGITLLLGIATRISLFAMGLVYISLTFGLILIAQDAGIAWLGVHMIMIVMALLLAKHNRFTILNKW